MREQKSVTEEDSLFHPFYYQQIAKLTGSGGWGINFVEKKSFIDAEGRKILNLPKEYEPSLKKALDFYAPEHHELAQEKFMECSMGKSFSVTIKMLTYDQKVFWSKAFGKPILNEQGEIIGIQGVFQNIDEEKIRALQLEKSMAVIESQNARLSHFAHIVSHHLKSHAGNLSLSLELLKDAASIEEREELTQHLFDVSKSLNTTVAHLDEIMASQTKSIECLTMVSLDQCFKKVHTRLYTMIQESKVDIYTDFSEVPEIEYVPYCMESIFSNLISNAIKYRHPDRTPTIDLFSYHEDGANFLLVRDNGSGIDLEKHGDELFHIYQTFHDSENAVGIGLFIIKNQIETLQGTITVESTVGEGTTFRIRF